jgi:hypothetical protein
MTDKPKPPPRPASSTLAILALARAGKRAAAERGDQVLLDQSTTLEERAIAAIKDGKAELPELN